MSVSKKLSLIIFLTIFGVSVTIWAAFQIAKGSDFHHLNLLHIRYANQYEFAINSIEKGGELKPAELKAIIQKVKDQPETCLSRATFVDRIIMNSIGTSYAFDICEDDIKVAVSAVAAIDAYQAKEISKRKLVEQLRKTVAQFHEHSINFQEPISKTVNFIFWAMVPLIIFISFLNIFLISYLSKSITKSLRDAIKLLKDEKSTRPVMSRLSGKVSGDLLQLLEVSRQRVKDDLLNIETSKELKSVVAKQTKKLQATLTRHDLALKASRVGVWDWDLKSDELIWDEQMYVMYGVNKEDFDGAYSVWESGLHLEDKEQSVAQLQEVIQSGAKFDTEFRIVWPSGEVRNIRALGSLVTDEDGQAEKVVGVNWDITDERNYEYKLEQANIRLARLNEELSQFAYRTSHDLKAPLISTKRLIKYVIKDIEAGDLDAAKENSAQISRLMDKLSTLVEDILALVKADVDINETETVDIHKIALDIEEKLAFLAKENSCTIDCTIDVRGDVHLQKARIVQVLENLMSNGIKYRSKEREQSFVRANITQHGDDLLITVEDNGVGMPENRHEEVFKAFKRFHPELSFGSGLGMSIVKKHVDHLQGEITFSSSNEGTRFKIRLPSIFQENA